MISFRYHLVTIVAVFLAIALGVLMGTTVVNQGVIDDLNRRTDDAVKRAGELRDQVDTLSLQVRVWEQFGRTMQPLLIDGALDGRDVVLVTLQGVDVAEVDDVRKGIEASGATVVGLLVVTPEMAVPDEAAREGLARLLDSSASKTVPQLQSEAAGKLGERLAQGPGNADVDLLGEMVSSGFVVLRGDGSVGSVGGPSQGVVLLSGGETEPPVAPEAFLTPLAVSLASFSTPVIAAETTRTTYPFVPLIRRDGTLDGDVATVDNADMVPGRIAVVLALRDLFAVPGSAGDYGVKDGASGLLPPQ